MKRLVIAALSAALIVSSCGIFNPSSASTPPSTTALTSESATALSSLTSVETTSNTSSESRPTTTPVSTTSLPESSTSSTSVPGTTTTLPPTTTVPTTLPATTTTRTTTSTAAPAPVPTTKITTTTTRATTSTTAPTPVPTTTASADPYTVYPNTDLSWWYIPPKPLNQQLPAKIDPGIAALIAKYSTLWQLPSGSKKIYITMDEGYEFETNTAEILDIAKAKNIPITFFVTGSYLNHNLPLVKRMLAEGHQVANHSFNHLRPAPALAISTDYYIADIQSLASRFHELTGSEIAPFYRPPEGGYSERALKIVEDLGYTTVFWSFAYRDWLTDAQPDITAAFDRISGELHDGSILLLHAVSDTNVAVLAQLIDFVRAQGYVIAPLPR